MMIQPGQCGMGTGEEATGEPIKLGGMATNIPGVDFTWIPQMAAIYFDCVNANGGIDGRPIEYSYEDSSPDPALLASLATKLVEEDQVLGIVGNTDLLECDINGEYYEENGYHPIIAGVAPGCFTSPQLVRGQHGPVLLEPRWRPGSRPCGRQRHDVVVSPDQPGMDFNNTSVTDFADEKGLEGKPFLEDVPIADPAGSPSDSSRNAVTEAVSCSTSPAHRRAVAAGDRRAGSDRLGDLGQLDPAERSERCRGAERAMERQVPDQRRVQRARSGLPDNDLMLQLHEEAGADFPISSFAQMGYLVGRPPPRPC